MSAFENIQSEIYKAENSFWKLWISHFSIASTCDP